ncbi:tRNA guanosine(34) transglycosylase Tgt [Candidatus Peregrinibacteria bacterium]|nr:tRNA guanosine(34) transglycosylase Tgt [Candidatus Peregrinibacteria bacterium]
MFNFKIHQKDSNCGARTGTFTTPHGEIKTPIFMPVGTLGTVKGVSTDELNQIETQILLANTYHLYLRPGANIVQKQGGLHQWINWNKPILTDSGGFQVFSLGKENVKIKEDGVEFKSHLDGSKHFFSPERVIDIQHQLGADIIMQIDECAPHDSSREYAKQAMERTHRWAKQCISHHQKLEKLKNGSPPQALFPIIQGVLYEDLRIESTKFMASLDTPGIAIGGLSVGEERAEMYHILDVIKEHLPTEKPRYLMGVGTPIDLLESIERGIDMFDCVHATRIARHGNYYDNLGRQNIKNSKYANDSTPIDLEDSNNPIRKYSKSYLHHLVKNNEMLGLRLLSIHNIYFLLKLMSKARNAIKQGEYMTFKHEFLRYFKPSV